jgi:hypothetical protein
MVPLSVPEQDRRIVVRSFWLLISAIIGLMASIVGWAIHTVPWAFGIGAFVAAGSLAFLNEQLVRRLYHAWNNRIIRPLSNVVSVIILRVCLLIIFTVTGRAGSRLAIAGRSNSMWISRSDETNYTSLFPFVGGAGEVNVPNGWIGNYVRWAARSHNMWAIFLIPFFCLLRLVSTEEPSTSGGNIYTLF